MLSGQKVNGKTRYFRSEGGAVPEREAGSVFGPATPLGQVKHWIADRVEVYVGFESAVFGFGNTIGEAGHRIAPCL